jgi:hypothetical protein
VLYGDAFVDELFQRGDPDLEVYVTLGVVDAQLAAGGLDADGCRARLEIGRVSLKRGLWNVGTTCIQS